MINFEQRYQRLNPAQREAVDTIEGPVMVVAGPGTGKTQVLTLRIANILRQTDTPPDAILALTFTQSGAQSMRERLVEFMGSAGYRVNINTFHGFCNEIIQRFPEEFPRIIGSRNASQVEQIKIVEKIINSLNLELLRPYGAPFYYLPAVLDAIEKLKKENQTPEILAKQKFDPKERELILVYREYEKVLRQEKLYDFADMIMEVLLLLKKKKNFLRKLQEEYLYILADEHQDANQSQNELLALLSNFHSEPNLFIVGDEKQAIFQFQGASLDNFNYFKKLYPNAKLIRLTHSYRATQNLLDGSHSVIKQSNLSAESLTALQAVKTENQHKIKILAFADQATELQFIATEIKTKIESGLAPDEIAVIYRDNADAVAMVEALERVSVPFVVQSQTNLLADLTIGKLVLILETVYHFGNADYLRRFLQLDLLGLDSLAVYQIKDYEQLQKAKGDLALIYKKLEKWHRLSHNRPLLDLFGVVLEDTEFLEYLLREPDAETEISKLQSFYEELKELASNHSNYMLGDFIDYLETLKRHNLGLAQKVLPRHSGVRLLTAHRAKGLEFDQVYIIGATDGHFGRRRQKTGFNLPLRGRELLATQKDDDDERRLFYVALTRARDNLTVTYAKHKSDGRPQLPSQFIEEIDKQFVEFIKPEDLKVDLLARLRPKPVKKVSLTEKAHLNKLFLDRGLSVTDLNNYLKCPLQYFYLNLLRLTQVQEKHLLYGTAIHQTLKEFFDQYREGKKWEIKKVLARLKYHLQNQPFSPKDLADSLAKGEEALTGYLNWHKNKWPNRIVNEFNIRGVFLGEIKLNGKIDKLEIAETGETRVVDYKTGKPKTRNHIMGLTKSPGSGDYFRQLVFYKLLLETLDKNKYRVTAGLIDFIEPDDKARYHQEEFALTEQDVIGLTEQIKQVTEEILSLKFLEQGCGEKDCEWCHLWAVTH